MSLLGSPGINGIIATNSPNVCFFVSSSGFQEKPAIAVMHAPHSLFSVSTNVNQLCSYADEGYRSHMRFVD